VTFEVHPLRFSFRAADPLYFPPGKSANILRGAFGLIFRRLVCVPECADAKTCERKTTCPYARFFEPSALGAGPSGLADWPRPFVFRATHLDGSKIAPDDEFSFGLNLFDCQDATVAYLTLAFAHLAREGLGPGRGKAELVAAHAGNAPVFEGGSFSGSLPAPLALPLASRNRGVQRATLRFVTPTEIKAESRLIRRPEFSTLFARLRDRVSNLSALYAGRSLEIDHRAIGERAAAVRLVRCDLRDVEITRRSSRTNQEHPLGGFVGEAEYEGDLDEFLPFLEVARYTGVGRQTVWGKGEIHVVG
jgi:hypothetical protein